MYLQQFAEGRLKLDLKHHPYVNVVMGCNLSLKKNVCCIPLMQTFSERSPLCTSCLLYIQPFFFEYNTHTHIHTCTVQLSRAIYKYIYRLLHLFLMGYNVITNKLREPSDERSCLFFSWGFLEENAAARCAVSLGYNDISTHTSYNNDERKYANRGHHLWEMLFNSQKLFC